MTKKKSVGSIDDIAINFCRRIPISDFQPMSTAPMDGAIIYVMDDFGHVDLARYDEHGWTAEAGNCDEFTAWAKFHLYA